MSESKTVVSSGGIGITGMLTILFVLLKAFGVIAWSWWLVFAPLWIGFAIGLTIFVGVLLIAGVLGLFALLIK